MDKISLIAIISLFLLIAVFIFVILNTGKKDTSNDELFDDVLFKVPSVALSECNRQTFKMFDLVKSNLNMAIKIIPKYDTETALSILKNENSIDIYEHKLSQYIKTISGCELSQKDNCTRIKLHLTIGNIESLGNYAVKLQQISQKINEASIVLADEELKKLEDLASIQNEIVNATFYAYKENSSFYIKAIYTLSKKHKLLLNEIKAFALSNLQKGLCSSQAYSVYSSILYDFEYITQICVIIADTISSSNLNKLQYA